MKAITYNQACPIDRPGSLVDAELAKPAPGPRDLLIEVEAISVNPVDTKIRAGVEPQGPRVLGWDAVGTVAAVGPDASLFAVGDRVWYAGALDRPGSNAEFQCVDERLVSLAPRSLSSAQAAALPLTAITAWELLFERLEIRRGTEASGDVLLVSGAAGGVGSILLQLAAKLTSATVVATAGRDESRAWVTALGADHVLDYRRPLAPQLTDAGIGDVSHIASLTHTDTYFSSFIDMMRPFGRMAVIDDPPALDVKPMKARSLSLHWEFMFSRSMFQTPDMAKQGQLLGEVAELVDAGVVRTTLQQELGSINAANLRQAHERLERGGSRGKIVLNGFGA